MSITIKFVCDGDIRRTRMSAVSLDEVLGAAQQAFPEFAPGSYDLRYCDDEGDLCLLCASTSLDFMAFHEGSTSLRLEVARKKSQSAMPAENTQQQSAPKLTCQGASPTPVLSEGIQALFGQLAEALLGNVHNSNAIHPGLPVFGQGLQKLLGHACAHPGHASSHSQCGMPPFAQFLPQLLSGNADGLATLFVQFAPLLLHHLSSVPGALEKHASFEPEVARAMVKAVRNALEPFPQLHEVISSLDRTLQSESMEGLDQVAIDFLEAFMKLPQEQQHDIAPIVLGSMIDKAVPAVTAVVGERIPGMQQPQHQMHTDCGSGSRFRRSCPWGKGLGKGFGKGWGKGWGKEGGWRRPNCWSKGWGKGEGSSSESDSMSDSSSGPAQSCQEMQFQEQDPQTAEGPQTKKEAKRALREAKRSCKLALREAKKQYKAEKKVAKHLFREAKKVSKDASKLEKASRKVARKDASAPQEAEVGPAVPEATEAMGAKSKLHTFPVVVADGRRLEISWHTGDDHHAVAARFAAQHNIMSDEIATVLQFLAHAEQHAAAAAAFAPVANADQCAAAVAAVAASATAAAEDGVTDTMGDAAAQDAPVYTMNNDGHLQALQAMGFTNHHLNMQLLAEHQDNLEQVLQKLL